MTAEIHQIIIGQGLVSKDQNQIVQPGSMDLLEHFGGLGRRKVYAANFCAERRAKWVDVHSGLSGHIAIPWFVCHRFQS
jgi:hypothetical protein